MSDVCSVCGNKTGVVPVCKNCGFQTIYDVTLHNSLVVLDETALSELTRAMMENKRLTDARMRLVSVLKAVEAKRLKEATIKAVQELTTKKENEEKEATKMDSSDDHFIRKLFLSEKDYQTALEWFNNLDKSNYAKALNWLGERYEMSKNVKNNNALALRYYTSARKHGSEKGLLNLIRCYETGIGVSRNMQMAQSLYREYLKQKNQF